MEYVKLSNNMLMPQSARYGSPTIIMDLYGREWWKTVDKSK